MNRRPVPGPEPSLGARLTILRTLVVVLGETLVSGLRLLLFPLVRRSWRARIAERISADEDRPASPPPRPDPAPLRPEAS